MTRSRRLLALLCLGTMAGSCASIRFREAMNQVERRKAILMDELENGSEFAARDAARELETALASPVVASDFRHASDPEFRRLLDEALATIRKIHEEPSFQPDGVARFRSELLATCNGACHEKFKSDL